MTSNLRSSTTKKKTRRRRRRPEQLLSSEIFNFVKDSQLRAGSSGSNQVVERPTLQPPSPLNEVNHDDIQVQPINTDADNDSTTGHQDNFQEEIQFQSFNSGGRPTNAESNNESMDGSKGGLDDAPEDRPSSESDVGKYGHVSDDDTDTSPNHLSVYVDKERPTFAVFESDVEELDDEELGAEQLDDELVSAYQDNMPLNDSSNRSNSSDSLAVLRAERILASLKKKMDRSVFLGAISLYGKCRYTLEHYEHLVAMMRDCSGQPSIPCATTMRKVVFPHMLKELFVKSTIRSFPTKSGVSNHSSTGTKQTEAAVVLPSAWARIDIRCIHILREIVCLSKCRCVREMGASDLRVDSTNHVQNRHQLSRHADILWISKDGSPVPSWKGMEVKFHTCDGENLAQVAQRNRGVVFQEISFRGEPTTAFDAEIISNHHILYSSHNGITIETAEQPRQMNTELKVYYDEIIQYLQIICVKNHEEARTNSENADTDEDGPSLNSSPQTRRQRHKQLRTPVTQIDENPPYYLIPSDHLTIVRLNGTNFLGVYVSRFWVYRIDDERNVFLFLHKDHEGNITHTHTPTIGAPVFVSDAKESPPTNPIDNTCTTTGTLQDGKRFYVYRLLLYADDFNPRSTLFPKGSVGGLYLSPSSLNLKSRRSQSSVRTVSLTPAGVSTNSVLEYIIEDLVTGSIDGFDCVDAFGDEVKVFFDIMGFLGDYPAASGVVDLKGHMATAPCTVCGFTFNKKSGMSTYAFTTSISCCNTAYRRSQQRTSSIRAAGLTIYQNKCLGLRVIEDHDFLETGSCPLLKLASEYNKKLQICDARPSFSAYKKDGYMLNIVAPDHLISGLFKGVLTIVFIQLPTEKMIEEVQIYLTSILSTFGFQSQSLLFKAKQKKLVPGLSMSVLYCILTVLPGVLSALNCTDCLPSWKLLVNLHRFFSTVYWWPTSHNDGKEAWDFVHGRRMSQYHRSLQLLAANFVKSAAKFIKYYPDLGCHIDRPNIHRILELSNLTIPMFNHVSYIYELVFESSHQPLKFYLSRNHTLGSHIYAVHRVLAKDWMVRLWSLWVIYKDSSETQRTRHFAFTGILRLLVGEEVDHVNWEASNLSVHLEQLREHIHELMTGTVESRFGKWYGDTRMSYNVDPNWKLLTPPRRHEFSIEQNKFFASTAAHLAQSSMLSADNLVLCYKAILDRGYGSSGKSSHERLELGDIVQVLMHPLFKQRKFITSSFSEDGYPQFFVVGGFYETDSGRSWAVVKHCSLLSPSLISQLPDCSHSSLIKVATDRFYCPRSKVRVHYLELNRNVSKVGVLHNCAVDGNCKFTTSTRRLQHSTNTLEGGRFLLLTRSMAYPPRRS